MRLHRLKLSNQNLNTIRSSVAFLLSFETEIPGKRAGKVELRDSIKSELSYCGINTVSLEDKRLRPKEKGKDTLRTK